MTFWTSMCRRQCDARRESIRDRGLFWSSGLYSRVFNSDYLKTFFLEYPAFRSYFHCLLGIVCSSSFEYNMPLQSFSLVAFQFDKHQVLFHFRSLRAFVSAVVVLGFLASVRLIMFYGKLRLHQRSRWFRWMVALTEWWIINSKGISPLSQA